MTTTRVFCLAGAVSYDHLVYPIMTLANSVSLSESIDKGELAQLVIQPGSADLVAQLLTAAAPQNNFEVYGPSSFQDSSGFEVVPVRSIGRRPLWHAPPLDSIVSKGATTAVITGSGEAFQDVEPALDFLQRLKPKYIIHHMTRPLATSRLWDIVRNGPMVSHGPPDPDRLAVIIDADDLRAEGIALSRSLSWESSAEDFVRNLGSNGRLDTLVTCPNLIVRFGNEGIIHHRGRDAVPPKLYFPPRQMEKPKNPMVSLSPRRHVLSHNFMSPDDGLDRPGFCVHRWICHGIP